MKVALLTGAYKNAGDYLISKRAKQLLEMSIPNIEIFEVLRTKIVNNCDEINRCDVIIFSGGPIYLNDINSYLKTEDINYIIKKNVLILGGGWNGIGGASFLPYQYHFESKTRDFFERVNKDYGLACRDVYTLRVLLKEGFTNCILTGCPAWYEPKYIGKTNFRNLNKKILTIAVSDPALKGHYSIAKDLIYYLGKKYVDVRIIVVFHRGIDESNQCMREFIHFLREEKIDAIDISNGAQGLEIYDSCDLHIGFRVHAHIYNLSIRNRSILIEEDGRGAGVNQTLGLIPIRAYSDKWQSSYKFIHRGLQRMRISNNSYLIQEIDDYIKSLEQTDYIYIENAFRIMERCYNNMVNYIKKIVMEN